MVQSMRVQFCYCSFSSGEEWKIGSETAGLLNVTKCVFLYTLQS